MNSPLIPHWRNRGYLPHCEGKRIQLITIRLFDSLPAEVIERWKKELNWRNDLEQSSPVAIELRKRIDKYEDAGAGECHLKNPQIAELVQNAILFFDGIRYKILKWCIMPNHVHVLIELIDVFSLSIIIHSWKSYTAKKANLILNRKGIFWQEEYHDRYIRNSEHYKNVCEYIDNNPVAAGLVLSPENWLFNDLH